MAKLIARLFNAPCEHHAMVIRRFARMMAATGCLLLPCASPAAAEPNLISRLTLDQMAQILKDSDHEAEIVALPGNKASVIKFALKQIKDGATAHPFLCRPAEGCLAFAFKVRFPKYDKIDAAAIDEWNHRLAIGKAMLNADGSSEFSYGFSVADGVTPDHVKGAILLFENELRQFLGFIAQR
jgi:hypothetical protein